METRLHIGTDRTTLHTSSGETLHLAIGTRTTAAAYFHHQPPTEGEIERAIQTVEDEVTRARALAARHPLLWTDDPAIADLAHLAGIAGVDGSSLPVEAVERLFDLLAALSLGRPASSAGIPADGVFAARLLILRELMHHLGFAALQLRT
jgi:exopolyphosphatase/pppGpp-phosphohydrolase